MHLIADKMSSEDRIEALSHGFIDNDIMSAEISFRTNIDQRAVSSALAYKFFFIEEPGRNITLDEIANEIEALTEAPTDETKGIEDVGFEDALAILNCEEDILWEIGIYIEP